MNRRDLLKGTAAFGAGGLLGWNLGSGPPADATDIRFHGDDILGASDSKAVWYRYKFTGQPVMDNQIMWAMGLATEQLTDIGEVMDTALKIQRGDEVGWFDAWLATAARVRGYGEESMRRGHPLSAGSHYLRAGTYLRLGLLRYAKWDDPRLVQATRDTLELHGMAMDLQGYDSQQVDVPYEHSALVARQYFSPGVGEAPVLLMHQGLHAWPEDTMWVTNAALKHGYHVLALHGGGQGASLRLNGIPFRPDWEHVVSAAVDYIETVPRFDRHKITLMGLSFGGFLAPRAAAAEHRLHALVANPGVIDWGASMRENLENIPGLMAAHRTSKAAFNGVIEGIAAAWPDASWYFEDTTRKHGVESPWHLIDELRRYENHAGAGKIRCKTLIMDGAAEDATPGQSQLLWDALTCPKHMAFFDHDTAAQTHCQGGGQMMGQTALMDWLDENVGGASRGRA